MSDVFTPAQRSAVMARVRGKDTKPEMIVRRTAHRLGHRFRLHRKDLPGSPDLVFPRRRAVVFVHGCFWHGHACRRGSRTPKSNAAYWSEKIARNRARDAASEAALVEMGWRVLVIWECEIRDPALPDRLDAFLRAGDQAASNKP